MTLEGDDFNPKGLLTGGARQQVGAGQRPAQEPVWNDWIMGQSVAFD